MKSPQSEASSSSKVHRVNIQRELSQLIDHIEADARRVDDRRFRGLLEKSSEVLKGLRSLFERYRPPGEDAPAKQPASGGQKKSSVKPEPAVKAGGGKKAAATPQSASSGAAGRGKNGASDDKGSAKRPENRSQKNSPSTPATPPAVTGESPPPVAAPKPQDPAEIAAKAEQQRREARAPKMPGGQAAPRPTPPRSGKPVWRTPHSS